MLPKLPRSKHLFFWNQIKPFTVETHIVHAINWELVHLTQGGPKNQLGAVGSNNSTDFGVKFHPSKTHC